MTEQPAVARGATRTAERALAPDLARGFMLLLIAMSNTGFHLWAAPHGPSGWHPVDGSAADRVVQFLMITMLDLRIYPLFAFLFGYGMMRVLQRQVAAGTSPRRAVALLRRRSLLLVAFGFVHAALFLASEILAFYGLVSLFLGWLFLRRLWRRSGTLLVWAAVSLALSLLLEGEALWAALTWNLDAVGEPATEATVEVVGTGLSDPLAAAARRLETWAWVAGFGSVAWLVTPEILLGFWAARRQVLERPAGHRRLLGWTAAVGIPLGWLGGLPAALAHVGAVDVPARAVSEGGALPALADATGLAAGLGYVALFGLLAVWLPERLRSARPLVAVTAVGKRSLSSYLAHSAIFAPLLSAWGLGLGAALGSASMALFAVGVWLVTVVIADRLERAGRTGPAEALLRRLMYGRARP